MRRLYLSNGVNFALVSNKDYTRASKFTWHLQPRGNRLYAQRHKPTCMYLHNFIVGIKGLDHRDGDGLNCTRKNLRMATPAQNSANLCISPRNKSGLKGVSWNKEKQRWQVFIQHKFLGYFDERFDAGRVYQKAAETRFGKYALHRSRGGAI